MRVAAIDCGTNSIRLLVADTDGTALTDVVREMRVVRLGQGVDATGAFAPEALGRTFAAIDEYAELITDHGAEHVRFVATSATRDAANRETFFAGVRERLGIDAEVITGEEEAELSFIGATAGLGASVDYPALVMDLGGGSTELVLGTDVVDSAFSMDIGCVRMTERHMHSNPPTEQEIAAAVADIDEWYDRARQTVDTSQARTLVGVAGTITTVTAAYLDLPAYDPHAIHGAQLEVDRALETCQKLAAMTREERAALPYMHPGRVDVIGAGATVFSRLITRIVADAPGLTIRTSETDILDGIALGVARSRG
ncbi:Ppx/GppA family phosphatase [Brevibacterium sp. ACRRH]|uniref:Ppx/GppA phosphatase family protein n=1 Tax=Brevibacterium sp. ACRRH TaxID=2918183 RepID=UPI001EF57290|nr:Ppx/GppA phosphatase family protein [Brevibacterium sp. ACRRH]MCG7298415.1 Ppx/GppA family phosphatase [Brevibacterium sp. ACRRH]